MFIPFNQDFYNNALIEQKKRTPFMYTKYGESTKRTAGLIRGFVIEQHVSGYMKENYSNYYIEADNYQIWEKYCNHDFKLKINESVYEVDVSGPKADNTMGTYPMKPKCEYHIIVRPKHMNSWNDIKFEEGFIIIGVIKGKYFTETLNMDYVIPFDDWLVSIGIVNTK
jgi:hypothetical protein